MPRDTQVNTNGQNVADTVAGDAVCPVGKEGGADRQSPSLPDVWDGMCLIALNGLLRGMKEGVFVVAPDVDEAQFGEIRRELGLAAMALDQAFQRRGWERSKMYSGHFTRGDRRKATASRRRERVQ
jgi:hypothetical protein